MMPWVLTQLVTCVTNREGNIYFFWISIQRRKYIHFKSANIILCYHDSTHEKCYKDQKDIRLHRLKIVKSLISMGEIIDQIF